jgi:hypothetical protein
MSIQQCLPFGSLRYVREVQRARAAGLCGDGLELCERQAGDKDEYSADKGAGCGEDRGGGGCVEEGSYFVHVYQMKPKIIKLDTDLPPQSSQPLPRIFHLNYPRISVLTEGEESFVML